MKKWILLIGLLTYSSVGWSEETVLEFSCKVTSQSVTHVLDGRTEVFTGYVDHYEVGDFLSFRGTFDGETLSFRIFDDKRPQNIFPYIWFVDKSNIEPFDGEENGYGKRLRFTDVLSEGSWSENHIRQEGFFDLRLFRYYKSDWDGLLTQVTGGRPDDPKHTHHVTSLDCKTIKNKFLEFRSRFGS